MKCKFCGCTDERACHIPHDAEGNVLFDSISIMHSPHFSPCSWLIPNVCTAPACVEKAYLALRIVDGVGLELIAR